MNNDMLKIIKNNKYDTLFNEILHYSYFFHQLFFVISAMKIIKEYDILYNVVSSIMIFTFIIIAMYDLYIFLRGKFSLFEISLYAVISIFLLISLINYKVVMVFANIFFIAAFKETDGKRALKYFIFATFIGIIVALLFWLFSSYTGNVVQFRHGENRIRYGLGFFYVTMAPMYFSSIVFTIIAIKDKLRIHEYIILIIIDIILYILTDTKATFAYAFCALLLHYIICNINDKFLNKLFSFLTIFSFFIFFAISYFSSLYFDNENFLLNKFNSILTGRLRITNSALLDFGFNIFGQTVPIVYENPSQHVDSSMISMLMLNGLAVFLISILFMTFFAYLSYKTKKYIISISLFLLAIRSAFDFGFMAMQFSPIILLFYPTLRKAINENKIV